MSYRTGETSDDLLQTILFHILLTNLLLEDNLFVKNIFTLHSSICLEFPPSNACKQLQSYDGGMSPTWWKRYSCSVTRDRIPVKGEEI